MTWWLALIGVVMAVCFGWFGWVTGGAIGVVVGVLIAFVGVAALIRGGDGQ